MNSLLLIFQSQLCMAAKLWHNLLSILPSVLPILQGLINTSVIGGDFSTIIESLLNYPQSILDANGRPAALGVHERFRASLRILFHRAADTRRKGFARTLTSLTDFDREHGLMVNYTAYTHAGL